MTTETTSHSIELRADVLADLGDLFQSYNIRPAEAACYLGFLIGYASVKDRDATAFDAFVLEAFKQNLANGRQQRQLDIEPTEGEA